jgi:hypothetical protein
MGKVANCRTCGSGHLKQVLDLGEQPLAERDDGRLYPLELVECEQCRLVQLGYIVPQRELFPEDHPYATGNTQVNREHFAGLARKVAPMTGPGDLVVDIGANDGTFLAALSREVRDLRLLAVEPTGQVRKCQEKGLLATQAFFSRELVDVILADRGPAKVITACNVLAHVPYPHDFLGGVVDLLADDGTFVTENHDWASIVNGLQIDTIYHEHLRYYSVASLSRLLAEHGLLVTDVERIAMHGGSFRVTAVRQQGGLAARAGKARRDLCAVLSTAAARGPVYGIGACTRATPLIHYAGIDRYLACICEVSGSEKIGMVMPGTTVPVVDEKALVEDQPPYALLFAWHVAGSIMPKLRDAGYKGQFIIPLPEPRFADG